MLVEIKNIVVGDKLERILEVVEPELDDYQNTATNDSETRDLNLQEFATKMKEHLKLLREGKGKVGREKKTKNFFNRFFR